MRLAFTSVLLAMVFTGCTLVPDVTYRALVEGEQPGWTGDEFTRYNGYDNVAGTMQVSAAEYATADGKHTVTLVGAVHIGDQAYYQEIQKILDASDLVFYELVKPEGMEYPPAGLQDADGMYSGMAELFGLSEQMHEVDYNREHFAWLDMSQEEFSQRIQGIIMRAVGRLGEAFGSGMLENPLDSFRQALLDTSPAIRVAFARTLLGVNMKAAAPTDPIAMLMQLIYMPLSLEKAYYRSAKTEKAFEDKYKHNMNGGLQDPEQAIGQLDDLGELGGADPLTSILTDALAEFQSIIVEDRNKIVIEGVLEHLRSGEAPAKIAVFYGAAHNPGIAAGLIEAGLKPTGQVQWMDAIDIQP